MDCATMRSDVIGDFHEPYGAVLIEADDMATCLAKRVESKSTCFHLSLPRFTPVVWEALATSAAETESLKKRSYRH